MLVDRLSAEGRVYLARYLGTQHWQRARQLEIRGEPIRFTFPYAIDGNLEKKNKKNKKKLVQAE